MALEFTDQEQAFLSSRRLARIASVSANGQPDVSPVSYEFDGEHFYSGGLNLPVTYRYRNVQINDRVAFVVDDVHHRR